MDGEAEIGDLLPFLLEGNPEIVGVPIELFDIAKGRINNAARDAESQEDEADYR